MSLKTDTFVRCCWFILTTGANNSIKDRTFAFMTRGSSTLIWLNKRLPMTRERKYKSPGVNMYRVLSSCTNRKRLFAVVTDTKIQEGKRERVSWLNNTIPAASVHTDSISYISARNTTYQFLKLSPNPALKPHSSSQKLIHARWSDSPSLLGIPGNPPNKIIL